MATGLRQLMLQNVKLRILSTSDGISRSAHPVWHWPDYFLILTLLVVRRASVFLFVPGNKVFVRGISGRADFWRIFIFFENILEIFRKFQKKSGWKKWNCLKRPKMMVCLRIFVGARNAPRKLCSWDFKKKKHWPRVQPVCASLGSFLAKRSFL